jgi:integrase/recombinase XerD
MDTILRDYKNLLLQKRYSDNTIGMYCNYFEDFCKYFNGRDLKEKTTAKA